MQSRRRTRSWPYLAPPINVDASTEDWIGEVRLKTRNLNGLQELALTNVFAHPPPKKKRLANETSEATLFPLSSWSTIGDLTLIHSAIESINPDVDFSDLTTYLTLPFPFPPLKASKTKLRLFLSNITFGGSVTRADPSSRIFKKRSTTRSFSPWVVPTLSQWPHRHREVIHT